jgi:hypothetical protein
VVDPELEQEDRNRTNNTAILTGIMKPDMTVESILVQEFGKRYRLFTIRVRNAGALDIDGVEVTMRLNSPEGRLLKTLSVTETP